MKTVLVTGANRGIGLEFCRQFRELGNRVVAVCRKPSDELKALGVAIIEGVDISLEKDRQRLCERVLKEFLPVDILVNNAGIARSEVLGRMSSESLIEQFNVNAAAPLCLTDLLLPVLAKDAKICFISSRMGSIADNTSGQRYGYRMSKTALNMAAVSLSKDLEKTEKAVALFHPGYVKTDMTGGSGLITAEESVAGMIPQIQALKASQKLGLMHTSGELLPW